MCNAPGHRSKPQCVRCASEANDKSLLVVGSINADLTMKVQKLPLPGETISAADLQRFPGGKVSELPLSHKESVGQMKKRNHIHFKA